VLLVASRVLVNSRALLPSAASEASASRLSLLTLLLAGEEETAAFAWCGDCGVRRVVLTIVY
jgi:hypothetical protein